MNVPFLDLAAHHAPIREELALAIDQVIGESAFAGGRHVEAFEHAFARYCGVEHAVGTSSGTDALWLALLAAGVGPGDEVITVPNTFIATATAILRTGARPVFVDVDPETYTLDPDLLATAVTGRTRAVIPVHLFGLPADMTAIREVADRHGLFVLEDACQAHGALFYGRRAGSLGHAGCFSFYPGKNLGAFGDGGAVVTNDPELAETLRVLRDHGRTRKNLHAIIGANARLDGMQAAVLGVKLRRLDAANAARRRVAALYHRWLEDCDAVVRPFVPRHVTPAFHLYAIQAVQRDELLAHLQARGIGCAVHYPVPLHRQPALRSLDLPEGAFPVAEQLATSLLSLPMYPELRNAQIEYVVECIGEAVGGGLLA